MNIPNIIADFSTILALKVGIGDTTATLESVTDLDGHTLANGVYSFTIDRKNSNKEYITCTLTGTSLTNIATVDRGTGVATAGFAKVHRKGAEVIISDFVSIKRLQDIFETGYAGAYVPTTDYQLATKKYVDDLALGGTTTVDRVVVVGTCGEAVSTGELIYLKKSDSKWYLVDADDSTTTDNVILGIAQGDGLINELINGGILITGVDTNQTGLIANSVYYASNTAGAISSTSGTNTRVIGFAIDTDKLHFNLDFIKPTAPLDPIARTYTSNATWTKPEGLKYIEVEVQAGGGGGGTGSSSRTGGSGGAAGGYSFKKILESSLGATETVIIGAGGSANNGGSTSSFGTHLSATGGNPGASGGNTSSGGSGSGGDINIQGQSGQECPSGFFNSTGSSNAASGAGGSSKFGFGGTSVWTNNTSGLAGTGYGSGGSGGGNNGYAGGSGAPGIVIIKEFY
jgi:hypothetical protein